MGFQCFCKKIYKKTQNLKTESLNIEILFKNKTLMLNRVMVNGFTSKKVELSVTIGPVNNSEVSTPLDKETKDETRHLKKGKDIRLV